ncbi:MAG TPA: hypothetical protein DEF43_12085 [Chloroflexus aurantiacus]|nr:MAG: hypothetical protein D6716_12935 [Chloroflexota bacterium]HBW67875.1 hypothetical protein [Chloroflexus aurantiacus]
MAAWKPESSGPVNPQDLNRSAYALNNPLTYTDPTGHCPTCVVSGRSSRRVLPRLDGVGHPPVGLQ